MTTFVLNTGLGMGLVARLACDKELTTTKLDWRVTEGELEDTMEVRASPHRTPLPSACEQPVTGVSAAELPPSSRACCLRPVEEFAVDA